MDDNTTRTGPSTYYNIPKSAHDQWARASDASASDVNVFKTAFSNFGSDILVQQPSAYSQLFNTDVRNVSYSLFTQPEGFGFQESQMFSQAQVLPSLKIGNPEQCDLCLDKIKGVQTNNTLPNAPFSFSTSDNKVNSDKDLNAHTNASTDSSVLNDNAQKILEEFIKMMAELNKILLSVQNEMKRYQKG